MVIALARHHTDCENAAFASSILTSFLANSCSPSNLKEWFELCSQLNDHELLMPLADAICSIAPAPVCRVVNGLRITHENKVKNRIKALSSFKKMADKINLRFVLFKGMASSCVLYNSPYARSSGDIDIIVNADDIAKADYAAREAGWIEPGEAYKARRMLNSGVLTKEALENLSCPYPLRSNKFLPHFTNYYFVHNEGQIDSLEVHDRYHGLEANAVQGLLWNTNLLKIGDESYYVFTEPLQFILTALSLFEDAETIRANTNERGSLGLKLCVDLHYWLHLIERKDLYSEIRLLIDALDIKEYVSTALNDVLDLYPLDIQIAEKICTPSASTWQISYLSRSLLKEERTRNAIAILRRKLHLKADKVDSRFHISRWLNGSRLLLVGTEIESDFEFRVSSSNPTYLEWRIPVNTRDTQEQIVLQVVLITHSSSNSLGFRINTFRENNIYRSFATPIAANCVDGHATKLHRGIALETSCFIETDAVRIKTNVAGLGIPSTNTSLILCFPSASECILGQLYRRFAGCDFLEEATNTLG